MKKILTLLLLLPAIFLASCQKKTDDVNVDVGISGISLSQTTAAILVGQTQTLVATISPEEFKNTPLAWSSSDTSVATVEDGVVTAIKLGSATITVVSKVNPTKTAACVVTVVDEMIAVTSVALDATTLSLVPTSKGVLVATVAPENATEKSVIWSSSDPDVVLVLNTGEIVALKIGTAIITATSASDNTKTAECVVTVSNEVVPVTGITLNKEMLSIAPGNTKTLLPLIAPENATNKQVTWSSSDSAVATVSEKGEVTALKEGSAIITATSLDDDTKSATCQITATFDIIPVDNVTLNKEELALNSGVSETLTATVAPENATDTDVTWTSSDPSVATVSSMGVVTALKSGTVVIKATSVFNNTRTATCVVTVLAAISLDRTSQTGIIPSRGGTYTVVVTSSAAWMASTTFPSEVTITPSTGSAGKTTVQIKVSAPPSGTNPHLLPMPVTFTTINNISIATATWTGERDSSGCIIPKDALAAAGWPNFPGIKGLQVAINGTYGVDGIGIVGTWDPTMAWQNKTHAIPVSTSVKIGTGKSNTDLLLNNGFVHDAATYCRYLGPDWYLPSLDELRMLMSNQYKYLGSRILPGRGPYWSSSEAGTDIGFAVTSSVDAANVVSVQTTSVWKTFVDKVQVKCVRNI